MNAATWIASGLVSAAMGYAALTLIIIWLLPLTLRAKIIACVFYVGSGASSFGVAFGILLGGDFWGLTTAQWAVAFVIAQNIGIWSFVINTVIEYIMGIRRAEKEAIRVGADSRKLREKTDAIQQTVEDTNAHVKEIKEEGVRVREERRAERGEERRDHKEGRTHRGFDGEADGD